MHEDPQRNKAMMSQFMGNYPHRSFRIDPETDDYAYTLENMMVGAVDNKVTTPYKVQTYKWEIDPDTIADYQRHLDYSGHNIDPVEVEQAMHNQALQEAELKKASEIAAAGKEYWDAVMQGAIEFLSGGMLKPDTDVVKKQQDSGGRNKPVKMKNLRGEKPGFVMAEGTNWWSVNEEDPYWQTKRGFEEAMNLYGTKPSYVKEPSLEYNPKTGEYDSIEKEEFAEIKPTKRISL